MYFKNRLNRLLETAYNTLNYCVRVYTSLQVCLLRNVIIDFSVLMNLQDFGRIKCVLMTSECYYKKFILNLSKKYKPLNEPLKNSLF